MLARSPLHPELFTMASLDAATSGSESQLLVNVQESAAVLDPWENVLPKAKATISKFGYEIDDEVALDQIKHFYQVLRHGMAFDWVLNSVIGKVLNVFPFTKHFEFKGTRPFIESFADDPVFTAEMQYIDTELQKVLSWVFEGYPEPGVFKRLAEYANTSDLAEAIGYARVNRPDRPFALPTAKLYRTNYLVLLLEMLWIGVGMVKRDYWTQRFEAIRIGVPGFVIVVGNKFRAFAYGDLNDGQGVCWHCLDNGIRLLGISERQQDTAYLRAFPDEMTFFRIDRGTLYVDETMFPKVSFDDGETWVTTNDFADRAEVHIDKPMKLRIKYAFPVDPNKPKTIKVKATLNCVVKDATVTLDENGEAETQIVFRGNQVTFIIMDVDKKFPFGVFKSKQVKVTSFDWLE